MKKMHTFLKLFLFANLGSCIIRVLLNYIDYVQNPSLYEVQSAPWYTQSLITVVSMLIAAVVATVALVLVDRAIRKKEQ